MQKAQILTKSRQEKIEASATNRTLLLCLATLKDKFAWTTEDILRFWEEASKYCEYDECVLSIEEIRKILENELGIELLIERRQLW